MTAMTRGPLPARVYWRRRLVLVLTGLAVVVAAVRLAGLGADDPAEQRPRAEKVAAEPRPEAEVEQPRSAGTTVEAGSTPGERRRQDPAPRHSGRVDAKPALAEPEGVCSDRDVAVTPTARRSVAGSPVTFALELRTITTPACTWQVGSSTMTVRITSGDDDIWTSQECPRAIPSEDVVLRNTASKTVAVTWSGRRSDEECSRFTDWALPGWYYVDAAALAGEPSDLHFELEKPEPEVVEAKRDRPRSRGEERDSSRREGDRDRDRGRDRRDGNRRDG